MNELELYKSTLELIAQETTMMHELKFGTPELERQMMSTHNLKINLFAVNALNRFAPKEETSK